MLPLDTDRLVLRDFKPEDFEAFYATTQDPEYRKFYSELETSREQWESIFESILSSIRATERLKFQLAVCLQTGELIGTCGLRIEDQNHQQASFGCALAKSYWGKGLALEASRRVIDFGFTELPIHRIFAETISENAPARALAERLGMRQEGKLREARFFRDRWWDTVVYAIIKDEWIAAGRLPSTRVIDLGERD